MPPKKGNNNNNNQKGGGKKKKDDDDFDALLANAVKETNKEIAKNAKNTKSHHGHDDSNGKGAGGPPVSMAAHEKPVPSSADHAENPYRPAFTDPESGKAYPRQTWPEPTIAVADQFPSQHFPPGDIRPYSSNDKTKDSAAERAADEKSSALLAATEASRVQDLRQAAEVHRQVRRWAQSWVRPGLPLMLIADRIEKKLEELVVKDHNQPLLRGQAFPTGVSLNHVAAHYTPNTGDEKVILGEKDVIKIDFGTHVNGQVVDSAWSMCFDPQFQPLLDAVKAATYAGVAAAGADAILGEIGADIQEVMESHECEVDGKVHQVKSIRNLSGHNLETYIIHGGKSVPIIRTSEPTRMQEGELFAIETFGSINGRAQVQEGPECSHYMASPKASMIPLRSDRARQLLKHIQEQFSTLAFCRKWLDRGGQDKHLLSLNQLVEAGAVNAYPELIDTRGSYSAQFEHTLILKQGAKEVVSWGDDY